MDNLKVDDFQNTYCKWSEETQSEVNSLGLQITGFCFQGDYILFGNSVYGITSDKEKIKDLREVELLNGEFYYNNLKERDLKGFKEPKLYQSLLTKDGRKTGNAVVVEVSEKYTLCKIRTDYGNTVKFNFKKFDIEEQFYLGRINENHKEIAVYNSLLEHRLELKLDTQYDTRILLAQKEESLADTFSLSYYKELLRHNVTDENERGE